MSDPPTKINLICNRQYQNNGKFDVYATWTIVDKAQALSKAIDRFVLTPQLVDTSLSTDVTVEVYETIPIKPNVRPATQTLLSTKLILLFL